VLLRPRDLAPACVLLFPLGWPAQHTSRAQKCLRAGTEPTAGGKNGAELLWKEGLLGRAEEATWAQEEALSIRGLKDGEVLLC